MELEKQICSLELAKRLKELGVKQDGYFCYFANGNLDSFFSAKQSMCGMLDKNNPDGDYPYSSAFTVAELGEMLGEYTDNIERDWDFGWTLNFNHPDHEHIEGTEADARAKMLIYLIENKIVSV